MNTPLELPDDWYRLEKPDFPAVLRRTLHSRFSMIHEHLSDIRTAIEKCPDDISSILVEQMEMGALAPMLRLRKWLDIPYDYTDPRQGD